MKCVFKDGFVNVIIFELKVRNIIYLFLILLYLLNIIGKLSFLINDKFLM